MHETEEKTLNSLVPLGLIRAFQSWFRGFQGQRVGDSRPCPKCGETTVWKNDYRTDRLFAILITEDGFEVCVYPELISLLSRRWRSMTNVCTGSRGSLGT